MEKFCGQTTGDVRYPEISEVGEASSWDPCRSGIRELHYSYIPLDYLTSDHQSALGGPFTSISPSSIISMMSAGVAGSILATCPGLLDSPPGKVELEQLEGIPEAVITIDVIGTVVAFGSLGE